MIHSCHAFVSACHLMLNFALVTFHILRVFVIKVHILVGFAREAIEMERESSDHRKRIRCGSRGPNHASRSVVAAVRRVHAKNPTPAGSSPTTDYAD